jgi:hypothetical protein
MDAPAQLSIVLNSRRNGDIQSGESTFMSADHVVLITRLSRACHTLSATAGCGGYTHSPWYRRFDQQDIFIGPLS